MEYATPILIITALIIINGFFVAAEFSLAGVPQTRIAQMAEAGSAQARHILDILRDRDAINRYLSTAQVGITLASLGLGMYGEHAVAEWFIHPLESLGWIGVALAHTLATIISVAVLTYLHVVLGEMIPKTLALQSATRTVVALAPAMAFTERVFRPLTFVLNGLGNAVLRLMRVPPADAEAHLISTEELAYIVEDSSEGGMLDPTEQLYLENALDFQERVVNQVMTPRTRMITIDVNEALTDALRTVITMPHSRYPVYEEDVDHITGILHAKDLARLLVSEADVEQGTVRDIMREPVFVPESLALDDMLTRMRVEHIQVAIVVDEYGGTAGLVTLEDLVEELIGEFQDEFDVELPPMDIIDANTIRVRGDTILEEITQHFDIDFDPDSEADTIGGLAMENLGRIATPGESFRLGDVEFEVESMDGLAVRTMIIRLPGTSGEDAASGNSENNTADNTPDSTAKPADGADT
ncbi:MAG: HlyC/CorC family transporter [Caldilineaceae bacterium]|nr:HlyC/CorC family transporter [Caldilineaceae bacterium]